MPTLRSDRPDLFAAYQATHADQVEATLRARRHVASFAPLTGARHLFVGLFEVLGFEELPVEQLYGDPRYEELERVYGATDTTLANTCRGLPNSDSTSSRSRRCATCAVASSCQRHRGAATGGWRRT